MAHRHAVDYDQYFGPPEEHLRKYQGNSFYTPFLQPWWNDPQHNDHVRRYRWFLRMGEQDDDSDLIPEARPDRIASGARL